MTVLRKLALLTFPALVLCVLLAEILFRVAIPAAAIPYVVFDERFEMPRFDVAGPRQGLYTIGPLAERGGHWRINGQGWNSGIEYARARDRSRPLIAIVGDSYVAALEVEPSRSFGGVLRTRVADQADVYTFGISGTPLSGYLQTSRYVARVFNPDVLVVNVVGNDFDESIRTLAPKKEFLQFAAVDGVMQEQKARGYEPSSLKRLLRHSAFVRYLALNCRLRGLPGQILRVLRSRRLIDDPVAARLNRERPQIEMMIDQAVATFRRENPRTRLIFMLDAPRVDIYTGMLARSPLLWLTQSMRDAAERNGCDFIDLTPPFAAAWMRDRKMLNFVNDYHWNEAGHRVVADTLFAELRSAGVVH